MFSTSAAQMSMALRSPSVRRWPGRTPKSTSIFSTSINRIFSSSSIFPSTIFRARPGQAMLKTTQQFFTDLLENGYIEEKVTDQLYSEEDKKFLADRYVVGTCPKCGFEEASGDECQKCGASYEATDLINPRSKMTGTPLIAKATKHWLCALISSKRS